MALAPPNQKPVLNVRVNGTMHDPSKKAYNGLAMSHLQPGRQLNLQMDPENVHDPYAIKVKCGAHQIGWIPKSYSRSVTLDIQQKGMLYGVVTRHDYRPDDPYDCCLEIDLFRAAAAPPPKPAPRIIVKALYFCEEYPRELIRGQLKVGTKWRMHTNDGRTSVTLARPGGGNLMWFRKAELPALDYEVLVAHVLQESPLIVELLKPGQTPIDNPYGSAPPPPPGTYPAPSLSGLTGVTGYIDGGVLAAGTVATSIPLAEALEQEIPAALIAASIPTTKENTMSKFDSIIASNKSAAQTGAIMEAGRIANSQVAKLAAKQLPMMVRGYADTAIGKVIIANLAAQGAAYFRPEDARLAALTSAMMVQAFQVLMQTVDIEGFVDELLDSKDIKRAMSKLSDDGEGEEVVPVRTRRAAK